jgi:hypothetical protein
MIDRALKDAKLIVTKVFPAAAANDDTTTIDLQSAGYKPETIALNIAWPALPNLADAKTIIFTVKDSADDSSYAAINGGPSYTLTGAGGVGVAAGNVNLRLPATTRRYIRVNRAVLTAGGDNTAATNTVSLVV